MKIYMPSISEIKKIARESSSLDPAECKNAIYLHQESNILTIDTTKYKNETGVKLEGKSGKYFYVCTAFHNNKKDTESEIFNNLHLLDIFLQQWEIGRHESVLRMDLPPGDENIKKLNGFQFNTIFEGGVYDGFHDYVIAVINDEYVELWHDFHDSDPYVRWLAKSKYKWKRDNYIRIYEGNIKSENCTQETAKWISENMLASAEYRLWKTRKSNKNSSN